MLWKMLGPVRIAAQTMTVDGRSYAAAAGQPLDVPDFDGQVLEANGWVRVAPTGPTAGRPTAAAGMAQYAASEGSKYWDSTLGYLIVFAGGAWRNPATGAAV
jgi:hypothetical protein